MTTTKRLPNEGERAYYAFKTYCEMGAEKRSHEKVARKLGKSATIISRWASRHDWKERAALWDNEQRLTDQAAEEQAALELAREKARRREMVQESAWDWFLKLKAKAEQMLASPIVRKVKKNGRTITEPIGWSFRDIPRMVEVADQLARLSTGLATQKHELSGPDDKPFTIPSASTAPPTLVLNVTYDKDTDDAVRRFGPRPDEASRAAGMRPDET